MQVDHIYKPGHAVRVVTAASLFDGHDAAINIMRRILQDTGVEVIHLGHNRSAREIVRAAVAEDVQGIAVSSYQGGHMAFFKYIIDLLHEHECGHIKVFGGGGGVIVPAEIAELEAYGVTKIYSPEDGSVLGLQGMINHMVQHLDFSTVALRRVDVNALDIDKPYSLANLISRLRQAAGEPPEKQDALHRTIVQKASDRKVPVVGVTGTGGAGKSSLVDELLLRFLMDSPDIRIGVICVDPSRRKTGGALLGDRIRMNTTDNPRVYVRSLATRRANAEIPEELPLIIDAVKVAGVDLVIVETAGIGQGDSRISNRVDLSMYVMTSDFGASSQLEKIDMLDYADLIVLNKYEKRGAEDALADVRKQVQRNRKVWDADLEEMPVFGTIAAAFNDTGVTALYHALLDLMADKTGIRFKTGLPRPPSRVSDTRTRLIPTERVRYLSEIADTVRAYHQTTEEQSSAVRAEWHLTTAKRLVRGKDTATAEKAIEDQRIAVGNTITAETRELMTRWEEMAAACRQPAFEYTVRGQALRAPMFVRSLSGLDIPRIALPDYEDPGEIYKWLRRENMPGQFPYTAGVFPLKRANEAPTRMFAGEGGPDRTNQRFKLLSEGEPAKRLSTAFDSVTLYGCDPDTEPDVFGKVGTAGVSICTLDDIRDLYAGFDLCAPDTSVSMTINGPAPIMLAMFFNAAIDQQATVFEKEKKRLPDTSEYGALRADVLARIRGTVQADILKEDQGQNTCIFSIEFALKMMADVQEYFIRNNIQNFYSVSISGYHIAEAGANPITQLAFTLANGFTYLEYYRARGMDVDRFAPNFSFFFSNGMDPEYTVIGRVARRIWAVALRYKYGASRRSRMLKYHVQTSGRSLHSREIQFNDIRTTLQALCAIYDNCNSLHTNAYDEAITTPSNASVRRALAIQQIINQEWGLAKNENPGQGSFIVEQLTDLVEAAVLSEFDRITARGGVFGAMETGYQRRRIQEESMQYEHRKHTGELPIVGVNTFLRPGSDGASGDDGTADNQVTLSRATDAEKHRQLDRLADFKKRHEKEAPAALERLKQCALGDGNIFAELMDTVRHCSLGDITRTLYQAGGRYRRGM
ncbi:MAG: fused isobutyryl-CoA mutase/GTPase IcmF [Thermodesulfobacteriota bacterium]|nr:fused isobutyryl-CoA mutase/GTPase IcmF [Thermodesulfobacteriota bacterium]